MKTITQSFIKKILKPRKSNTNKSDYGHALLIVGNIGKMGAAVISANACMRSGVGLLTVNIPKKQYNILPIALPEAMTSEREKKNFI